ncbi:MAG: restriction endonuclease [Actinomycetota bacterium]|nr:restriction endonuclease [Actinomycetota bacterium]
MKLRGLTEEQQSVPGPRGGTAVHYRLAWARTLAKALGLITSSGRGVWALTEAGRTVTPAMVDDLRRARSRDRAAQRRAEVGASAAVGDQVLGGEDLFDQDPFTEEDEDSAELDERNWKEQLLDMLKTMPPDAFERLTQRLLREAGFTNVLVTGGSGDGGIDGTGVYRAMRLMSFPVYFQCKRYSGTVGPSKVRDFRGAMVGRGDKGLLITTGTFTADARAEATRDGAPPIDLVDGDQLAELLREFELGITTTQRVVYEHSIDPTFFAAI